MLRRDTQRPGINKGRRLVLALAGVGLAVAGAFVARALGLTPPAAQATNPPPATRAEPAPPPNSVSEYTSAIVASYNGHSVITREELGEYLMARRGVEKLDTLINNRIIEKVCKERNITVNAGEIEERFAEDLKDINVDRSAFVKQFLRRADKNLYEWKEDVLRQQLLLAKLCRDRVTVSEDDIRAGFEARYGEKVDCRVIHWADAKQADADYDHIRNDEQAFLDVAKHQHTSALASTGGKIAAFGRHNMENQDIEKAAFELKPGQVSPLVPVPDGVVVLRCEARIPADTSASFDKVKSTVADEIRERKVQKEIKTIMPALRKQADPQILLQKLAPSDAAEGNALAKSNHTPASAVAMIFGTIPITRQDLGEFLIARFGTEQLELLVNKRIVEAACREKNITVTEEEIDAGCHDDCVKQRCPDEATFVEEYLKPNHVTTFVWREDMVRPRLMLVKLCRDRVQATSDDLRAAFDAYHGEKVECRMILWPLDSKKTAMQTYAKLRDDDKEFDKAAKSQISPSLAKSEGRVTIGRHTTGNDTLEKKAFSLHVGEVSELFETPQGIVLLKCDRHVPPDTSVNFADRREALEREVLEKKTLLDMPLYFAELRKAADPRLLLHDANMPDQLKEQVEAEVKEVLRPGAK
jgi:parvulin-like peptidyl-prolyl isomerase